MRYLITTTLINFKRLKLNNTMKTALTKYIELIRRDIQKYKELHEEQRTNQLRQYFAGKMNALIEVEQMLTNIGLKEEKKQIIEAYKAGQIDTDNCRGNESIELAANYYYNEIYNSVKVEN